MQSFLFASRVFKFTGDILNVLLLCLQSRASLIV